MPGQREGKAPVYIDDEFNETMELFAMLWKKNLIRGKHFHPSQRERLIGSITERDQQFPIRKAAAYSRTKYDHVNVSRDKQ